MIESCIPRLYTQALHTALFASKISKNFDGAPAKLITLRRFFAAFQEPRTFNSVAQIGL